MFNKFKILSLIPARRYSSALKNKNQKKLNGLKLFEIAILASKKSKYIDDTYVSSDAKDILLSSKKLGVKTIKRSKKYSSSKADVNLVISDFLKKVSKLINKQKTVFVYLQPTSPFRNHKHIDAALNKFFKSKSNILVSVKKYDQKIFKSLTQKKNKLTSIVDPKYITKNRQSLPKVFTPNGAIYIFKTKYFSKNKKLIINNSSFYIMNEKESIDIDDQLHFNKAKKLSKKYLIYKSK